MANKKEQDPTVAGIIKARKGVKVIENKKIPKATILKTIRTWRPHY